MSGSVGVAGSDHVFPRYRVPLLWRVFAKSAVVYLVAAVLLAVTPATVSRPVRLPEAVMLTIGTAIVLGINFLLLWPVFRALDSAAAQLTQTRMLQPGQSLVAAGGADAALAGAVNRLLRQLEHQRRESGRTVLAAWETERRRIAGELHDEVGQIMLAVLSLLRTARDDAPPRLRELLRRAIEALRIGAGEFRRLSEELRPASLDESGLAAALNDLAVAFTARTGIDVSSRLPRELPDVDAATEHLFYRVARDSLADVARRSAANRVDLVLTGDPHRLVLDVGHDGPTMSDATVEGAGLTVAREHARLIGGDLSCDGPPGDGNRVRLVVPVAASG